MNSPVKLRPLTLADLDRFITHVDRQGLESGTNGIPIFSPRPPGSAFASESKRAEIHGHWIKPLAEPAWERAWGLFDGEKIVGHLNLRAGSLSTALHRATVGMGIEAAYHQNGFGEKLLRTAIEWAQQESDLSWLDLHVFTQNHAAVRLYLKCGFIEIGKMTDAFRMDAESISDMQMTLKIER